MDTQCEPIFCSVNEHVVAGACVRCAAGETNAAGDDASGADTHCEPADACSVVLGVSCDRFEQGYLKASNPGVDDQFGYALALDGDTLAVGAPNEGSATTGVDGNQDNDDALDSGAVYVFTRSGSIWAQVAYLKASNTGAGDQFGHALALDGDTLAVGAPNEGSAAWGVDGNQDSDGALDSGAVYVFTRSRSTWTQVAYLKASNSGAGDQFGHALALDGDTLAVGAPNEGSAATGVDGNQDNDDALGSGAVYVFTRAGNTWVQEVYLKASGAGVGDWFGFSVALDADTLAVGAPYESSASTGVNGDQDDDSADDSGAAYVFRRAGATWAQEAYIKASNSGRGDLLGHSVALDAETLAVGAPGEDSSATGVNGDQSDDNVVDSGAVYVFRRAGATWAQEAYIKASNSGAHDYFGWSVALGEDRLAVGADYEDSGAAGLGGNQDDNEAATSGAVYLFARSGTAWLQQAHLKASNTDAGDLFGHAVALDGGALAVGARYEDGSSAGVNGNQDNNETVNSGAVYIRLIAP